MEGYLQGFIIPMGNGQIVKALVLADGRQEGRNRADAIAEKLCGCGAWDCASFPVTDEERSKGEYARIMEA